MNKFLEGEIHIWMIDLGNLLHDLPFLEGTLSANEMVRAVRYRSHSVRQRFILARGALRVICSQYLGCDPKEIVYGYGEHGKPFVSQLKTAIQFNLTHSGGLALAAFSHNIEVGIDIEIIRPIAEMEIIVANQFSPLEKAQFEHLPKQSKQAVFFRSWVRKEAYVKGRGRGFNFPFNQFSVAMSSVHTGQLLKIGVDSSEVDEWRLIDLALPGHEQYSAALAFRSPENCQLTYHKLGQLETISGSY